MQTLSRILLATVSILLLSCTYAERYEADGSGDEIIVKFAADQAINETIVQAFDDIDAEASLEESVQVLSAELGVPFVYSRLTSGREVIVQVPMRQVYELVAERIRDADEVESTVIAKRIAGDVSNGPDEILVSIDSSKIELGPDVDVNTLTARLINDQRFPVICDIRNDGRLAVTPDFKNLVARLVKELVSRPDIDYAQANYQVRHYDNNQ